MEIFKSVPLWGNTYLQLAGGIDFDWIHPFPRSGKEGDTSASNYTGYWDANKNKWGFINDVGEIVIPAQYDWVIDRPFVHWQSNGGEPGIGRLGIVIMNHGEKRKNITQIILRYHFIYEGNRLSQGWPLPNYFNKLPIGYSARKVLKYLLSVQDRNPYSLITLNSRTSRDTPLKELPLHVLGSTTEGDTSFNYVYIGDNSTGRNLVTLAFNVINSGRSPL